MLSAVDVMRASTSQYTQPAYDPRNVKEVSMCLKAIGPALYFPVRAAYACVRSPIDIRKTAVAPHDPMTRDSDGDPNVVNEVVQLTYSTLHGGGRCPYLLCPGCGAHVRTLHLPPGRVRFRCRDCYDLTYRSCQESHKWESLFKQIAPPGIDGATVARLLRKRYSI